MAGIVCARLHELTGDARWKQRGEQLVRAFAGSSRELGLYAATFLLAVDWLLNPATHLVVVGDSGDPTARAMHDAARAGFVPRRVIQLLPPVEATGRALPPAMAGMIAAGRAPRAYACTGNSCCPPADDLVTWKSSLESLRAAVPA